MQWFGYRLVRWVIQKRRRASLAAALHDGLDFAMIRQDYVLRMIQEFMEALSRIRALRKGQKLNEAAGELDGEFQKLVGGGAAAIVKLSETELFARLVKEGPTQAVRDKALILTALLSEAGDVAEAQGRVDEAQECRLKALHLLLELLSGEEAFEWPEFVPKVDMLRETLVEPLPPRTLAMLMRYYERAGQLAKAEDALFALLDSDPGNDRIVSFGQEFYERLQKLSDAQLESGDLPRTEVEEGLNELGER